MSSALRPGSHLNSSRTSRSISLSDFMAGSSSVQRGLAGSADGIAGWYRRSRTKLMGDDDRSHDDHQLLLQVYRFRVRGCRSERRLLRTSPAAPVNDGNHTDRRLQITGAALRLSKSFVT